LAPAAKVSLPKTVAQNRNMIFAGRIFTRSKPPAREAVDSEHAKKSACALTTNAAVAGA
jgi:hypothetical protein